jgi:Tol biopolymer transport system component
MRLSLAAAAAALVGSSAAAAGLPAPNVWQPGVISTSLHDAAPAFTPDGRTVFFSRSVGGGPPVPAIYVSHRVGGRWTAPEVAPFSGRYSDMEPYLAPDGSYMIFVSNRPADAGGKVLDGFYNRAAQPGSGGQLWRVDRTDAGWSPPRRLPNLINSGTSIFAPAIAADGSLYFMKPNAETGRFQLFRAQAEGETYREPEPLPFSDGSVTTVDPAVAPDESFIVFGAGFKPAKALDMFVAFKRPDGRWGKPVHLGEALNAPGSDAEARLSPDGRTLYFSSERVSAAAPQDPEGWNNGKYNIWEAPLRPDIWRELRAQSVSGG